MSTTYKPSNNPHKVVDYNSKLIINELISKFALENSNIGVWDFDVLNKTVKYSKEAQQILDIDSKNQISYNWQEKVHPNDLDQLIENLKSHINNEAPNYISEHRILIQDGTYKWIKDIGKVVERDANGNHTRIIGTTIDISQRKKQEEKLLDKQNIIEEQNKILKNFALIVSHNLKSHTANFESLLSFHDEADDDKEKTEIITHLKTVNTSLTKTISNLNKIVKTHNTDNIVIQEINIRDLVEITTNLLETEIKASNAQIINTIDSNLFIQFNLTYFESIIQNLLSNAIKYRHPDRTPLIQIDSIITEDHISITISDNGLGIDLNKYGHEVFGLYRTFHNNSNSEGVGLYLTKNQIEAFNGSIDIKSEVNIGTTFTLNFIKKA